MKLEHWMLLALLLAVLAISANLFASEPEGRLIKATHTKAHCIAQGKSVYYSCIALHRPQASCARLYSDYVAKYCK